MAEKDPFELAPVKQYTNLSDIYDDSADNETAKIVVERGPQLGEAVDMYGDLETAEDFGYVNRGNDIRLKSRHIQFIALGGTVGTGFFLGIGRALTQAGPLSLLLGYTFTGVAIYAMMQCLGEMATWLPLPGSIPHFATRYVDGAMGFAVGWNNWISCALTLCTEISAASIVIQYWNGADDINAAIWITLIIVVVLCFNIFTVAIYGEAEFIFASIKLISIVGLLLFAFIIDLGGGPTRDRLGFRYWKHPGAMKAYISDGSAGRFLGFFSTLVNAAFAYAGVEMVAVAAGEAENPRKNIPKAVRRVFWRILFFYVLGTLAIGLLVPYNAQQLLDAQKNNEPGGAASPWVIACYRAAVPVLPSIINAVILTAAASTGNAFLYTGSRYLYALAQNKQAPQLFLRCSRRGVPYVCVLTTASISLLTYMSSTAGSTKVFTWFQNLTSITQILTWLSISIAYLRFHAALRAQGVDRSSSLVFKSPFQPYTAWFSLIFFATIALFNGFYTFPSRTRGFDASGFVTAYVALVIYGALFLGWKFWKGTRWVRSQEADIWTGKKALDEADGHWQERRPRNFWERMWVFIA
ncbi:hypothetical protein ACLMJK_006404 [Lecanora helva]